MALAVATPSRRALSMAEVTSAGYALTPSAATP